MSQSLAKECTPLKHEYDSCFNAWFAEYLQPTTTTRSQNATQQKVKEYEAKCGKVWEEYKNCVQKAVKDRKLNELLDKAKDENPLKGIDSIKDDK